jgi:hypothetical protein
MYIKTHNQQISENRSCLGIGFVIGFIVCALLMNMANKPSDEEINILREKAKERHLKEVEMGYEENNYECTPNYMGGCD